MVYDFKTFDANATKLRVAINRNRQLDHVNVQQPLLYCLLKLKQSGITLHFTR
jgi:hypothetical protein